jgi:excisionase family DNA binding protein
MATNNHTTPKLYVSQREASRLLGVDRGVVRRMIARGALKEIVLAPGLHPRLRRADIDALIREASR